jgi:ATP-binding cassette subfamily A (ABC1) protein 3
LRDFFRALEAKYGDGVQVSLKMNSLEDAFINIGMDEEKFIQRARKSIARNSDANVNEEISYDASATIEFNEPKHAEEMKALAVPECLSRPPVYSF